MVLLKAYLDREADTPGSPLGPGLACQNYGIDEAPGLQGHPRLLEAFPPGWLGNGLPELSEQAVDPIRGCRWLVIYEFMSPPLIWR